MASKEPKALPTPVNIRIPLDLLETIRNDATDNERTLSSEVRFLLRIAVAIRQDKAGIKQ